jgi:preprotein translocase subunit SecA
MGKLLIIKNLYMFGQLWKKVTLRKFARLQKQIFAQQKKTSPLSDEELKKKIAMLRKRISKDKNLDKHLMSAFSLTLEVIHRKIGLW